MPLHLNGGEGKDLRVSPVRRHQNEAALRRTEDFQPGEMIGAGPAVLKTQGLVDSEAMSVPMNRKDRHAKFRALA